MKLNGLSLLRSSPLAAAGMGVMWSMAAVMCAESFFSPHPVPVSVKVVVCTAMFIAIALVLTAAWRAEPPSRRASPPG